MIVKKVSRLKKNSEAGTEIGTGISIILEDGTEKQIVNRTLRTNCPCATCVEERAKAAEAENKTKRSSLLRVVSSDEGDQLNLTKIWLVGNYALGLRWGDGHDTGIYPFSALFDLANDKS